MLPPVGAQIAAGARRPRALYHITRAPPLRPVVSLRPRRGCGRRPRSLWASAPILLSWACEKAGEIGSSDGEIEAGSPGTAVKKNEAPF